MILVVAYCADVVHVEVGYSGRTALLEGGNIVLFEDGKILRIALFVDGSGTNCILRTCGFRVYSSIRLAPSRSPAIGYLDATQAFWCAWYM